jgi:hypothetical protein
MKYILRRAKLIISLRQFLRLCYYMTAGRIARESGGQIRSFSLSISFHHGFPCTYITWGINNPPNSF